MTGPARLLRAALVFEKDKTSFRKKSLRKITAEYGIRLDFKKKIALICFIGAIAWDWEGKINEKIKC
jgi:hypothetical protein